MSNKTLIVTAGVLAVAGWTGVAAAQGRMHGMGFGPGQGGPFAQLGLSEEQREQMKALHEKQRESMKPLFEAARKAHEAFQTAIQAQGADATKVGQAALAMKAAREKVEAAQQAGRKEIEAILTPEQRAKLESMPKRGGRGGFGPGFGPGGGPGGGPGFGPGDGPRGPVGGGQGMGHPPDLQ